MVDFHGFHVGKYTVHGSYEYNISPTWISLKLRRFPFQNATCWGFKLGREIFFFQLPCFEDAKIFVSGSSDPPNFLPLDGLILG